MNNKLISFFAGMLLLVSTGLVMAAELVNLNKADSAAIQQSLIGIGPIKAEAIVSYRKKNGSYKSIDDLLNVKGIGPGLVKKNKKYLSLSKGVVKGDSKKYAASKKQAKAKKSGSSASNSVTAKSSKKSDSKKTSSKKSSKTTSAKSKSSTTSKSASSKKGKVKCKGSKKLVSKQSECGTKSKSKKSKKKKSSKKKKAPAT